MYRKIPHLSPNMLTMLVGLKLRNRRGVHVDELDKRTLKALFSRRLVSSGRRDRIFLTTTGVMVCKLARYYA